MATAKELDAQWEAQYLVVKQKNDERVAAMKALVASPAYQNADAVERLTLQAGGPANDARLAFNAENQKLTALKYELDAAIAASTEQRPQHRTLRPAIRAQRAASGRAAIG